MGNILLFDLDGTLIDSAQGVYVSLRYAMAEAGLTPLERNEVRHFLGSPLTQVLARRYGCDEATAQWVLELYMDHYREVGLYETLPAPGMPQVTRRLKEAGFRLAVATCKPWEYCGTILERCGFDGVFQAVAGSMHNGVPEIKAAVIGEALRLLDGSPRDAVMVGDRDTDVIGARAWGIPCVGLTVCGYADPGELEAAGAAALAESAEALEELLMKQEWLEEVREVAGADR